MNPDILRGIAERQIAFRAQNERIYASAHALTTLDPIPFICECADPSCTEIVRLRDDEYDTITQDPRRFFNVSGHEALAVAAGGERVSLVVGEFTMVVKLGIDGDVAAGARGGTLE